MFTLTRPATFCAVAALAVGLSACAGTSEPARTAGRGSETSTAEALARIAHTSLDSGDAVSASSMLKRAHELDPKSAPILAELGRTLGLLSAWPEAAEAYRQATALAPNDATMHHGYASALLKLNQLALAEIEYRAALKIHEDASSLDGLGVTLDLQGRHDEAVVAFRKAYQLEPQSPATRTNLALSLALWGASDEAITLLAPVAAAADADSRQRQNLALVFGLAGEFDQAAAVGRMDLGESAVRNNLAYIETLRGLPPVMRVQAIMGAQTQPPVPPRKPITEASLTADPAPVAPPGVEEPMAAETPPARIQTPAKPAHTERSATIPVPVAKATAKSEETSERAAAKTPKAKLATATEAETVPTEPSVATDSPLVEPADVTTHIIVTPTPVTAAAAPKEEERATEPPTPVAASTPAESHSTDGDATARVEPSEPKVTDDVAKAPPAAAADATDTDSVTKAATSKPAARESGEPQPTATTASAIPESRSPAVATPDVTAASESIPASDAETDASHDVSASQDAPAVTDTGSVPEAVKADAASESAAEASDAAAAPSAIVPLANDVDEPSAVDAHPASTPQASGVEALPSATDDAASEKPHAAESAADPRHAPPG